MQQAAKYVYIRKNTVTLDRFGFPVQNPRNKRKDARFEADIFEKQPTVFGTLFNFYNQTQRVLARISHCICLRTQWMLSCVSTVVKSHFYPCMWPFPNPVHNG